MKDWSSSSIPLGINNFEPISNFNVFSSKDNLCCFSICAIPSGKYPVANKVFIWILLIASYTAPDVIVCCEPSIGVVSGMFCDL